MATYFPTVKQPIKHQFASLVYVYFPTVKQPIKYQFESVVDAKSFAEKTRGLGFKAKVKEE